MPTITRITLDEALEQTRTGDIWLFRGHTLADRAIRVGTNSPVNHVGMSVVIEDLPPLMWHAELGRSLEDLWSGTRQRGVQLHDLRAAVGIWTGRYHQDAWLRQLEHPPLPGMEDALLRTIARLDGTPFPSTTRLAGRWLLGRLPALGWRENTSALLRLRLCIQGFLDCGHGIENRVGHRKRHAGSGRIVQLCSPYPRG